ncbi:MAG TPA: flagellar M-ring protein FliF, partial [Rhodanobacteraceae bacterium]|nr:flagellar M-ring protein FliF [Rhodanobacteraceae bacterium]
APAASFWQRPGVMDLIKQGLGVLAALLLAFGLLRPMLRGLLRADKSAAEGPRPLPGPQQRTGIHETVAGEVDGHDSRALPTGGGPTNYEQKVGVARRVASENPRQVAQIVKNWVATDGT